MKKYYIVQYDNDANSRAKFDTLPQAETRAAALARNAPGRTVCVFQVKKALKVDTTPVVEVPTEG